MEFKHSLRILMRIALTDVFLALQSAAAAAQDGPVEFTSAPCSSLALGPTEEVSHLERIYLSQGTVETTQYKFFADPDCTRPMFSFVFKGGVELGGPVSRLEDTVEAKVTFERVFFTLDNRRGRAAANACGDGEFEVGVQRDVSDSTCLFTQPFKDCGFDYDIVRMKDGFATPGFRTANMCTPDGRPTRLQTEGARFLEQF